MGIVWEHQGTDFIAGGLAHPAQPLSCDWWIIIKDEIRDYIDSQKLIRKMMKIMHVHNSSSSYYCRENAVGCKE
jgi:hypothetical protein